MRINGGHLVAKYLANRGVKYTFGISGGHIESLLVGLHRYNINIIDVRHEQAAVMMSHAICSYPSHPAYSKDTGNIRHKYPVCC